MTNQQISPNQIGTAYALFDCNNSKGAIEQELPFIRESVRAPNGLELSLMNMAENPQFSSIKDPKLLAIIMGAKEAGMKYFMKAICPNSTPDEVASILNQAYQSPLYNNREQFRGEIIYKKGENYISRQ